MNRHFRTISADGHLELPPQDFTPYVAAEHRDRAPRLVHLAEGGDGWLVEGRPIVHTGANLTAGNKIQLRGLSYERPDGTRIDGAGRALQRLQEQDRDGVDAEILYPPIFVTAALDGVTSDDAYVSIVQAYNTYVAEEYCATAPDRLIACGVIPARGIDMAIAELRRCAALGYKLVVLSQFPSGRPNPSADDDPFWEAALELQMPLTAHTHMGHRYPPAVTGVAQSPPPWAGQLVTRQAFMAPAWNVAQLITAGTFDRFPDLQILFAETNASWMPMILHQLDENYEIYRHLMPAPLSMLPSEYFARHVLVSMVKDEPALRMSEELLVDNLMWGSDFPHSVGSWPRSAEWLDQHLGSRPELRRTILVDNPCRFLGLDADAPITPTPVPADADAT